MRICWLIAFKLLVSIFAVISDSAFDDYTHHINEINKNDGDNHHITLVGGAF